MATRQAAAGRGVKDDGGSRTRSTVWFRRVGPLPQEPTRGRVGTTGRQGHMLTPPCSCSVLPPSPPCLRRRNPRAHLQKDVFHDLAEGVERIEVDVNAAQLSQRLKHLHLNRQHGPIEQSIDGRSSVANMRVDTPSASAAPRPHCRPSTPECLPSKRPSGVCHPAPTCLLQLWLAARAQDGRDCTKAGVGD